MKRIARHILENKTKSSVYLSCVALCNSQRGKKNHCWKRQTCWNVHTVYMLGQNKSQKDNSARNEPKRLKKEKERIQQ